MYGTIITMNPLDLQRPRACVALVLILTLLSLGAFDVAICRGTDGHLGLGTRVSCCCRSVAPDGPSIYGSADVGRSLMPVLSPAGGERDCDDTSLLQGAPAAHPRDFTAAALGQPITVSYPTAVSQTNRGVHSSVSSESILFRLRSTTLLI